MKPRETTSVTIYTEKRFKELLRKSANDLGVTLSSYIRMAVKTFIKKQEKENNDL